MTPAKRLSLLLGPTLAACAITGCLAPGAIAAIVGITAAVAPIAGAAIGYATQAQRLAPGAPAASLDDVAAKLAALKRCNDAIAAPAADAGAESAQALIDAAADALRDVIAAVKAAQIAAAGKDGGT